MGESFYELGKTEESIEAFNNAVNFNPNFDKARFNLGRAYAKMGDLSAANVQLEILRNNKSDWTDRLYILINP